MTNKLYIGNLPYNITEDELKEFFASAGNVTSVAIIKDKMTGKSKGFGFVEYSTPEEAQNAISTLNGKEIDGRAITVDEARPPKDFSDRRNDNRGGSRW